MRESEYRERESSPAVRSKELLYDKYVPPGVTVCPGLVHAKPQSDITSFHFLIIDLYESKHQSKTYNLTMMMYHYSSLVKALEERFASPNQTELYRVQLTERRQKPAESLPELGQAIRKLVNGCSFYKCSI
jgi:hypothetical protein